LCRETSRTGVAWEVERDRDYEPGAIRAAAARSSALQVERAIAVVVFAPDQAFGDILRTVVPGAC
jgi:hypothetical protein